MRFTALACVTLIAAHSLARDPVLPDPSTGNVNGVAGVLYWPAALPKSGQPTMPLPSAEGCTVHLSGNPGPEDELQFACGKWFAPADGRYRTWIETADAISPTQNILVFSASPFRGRGLAAIAPVVPAGRIGIDRPIPSGESVRLFSTHTNFAWTSASWIFDRRFHSSHVVQMPAGDTVILGRFDRKTNDAIALSHPVAIRSGETQRLWPVVPKATDVLVILQKPPDMQLRRPPPSARLTIDGRNADVLVNGGDRIVAIWYGVDAPRAKIAFDSDGAQWPAREIRLTPGKVLTIRDAVKPLPSAKVSINAPVDTKLPDDVSLEIHRGGEILRTLQARVGIHELHELPAEPLRVVLRIGQWEWDERLDLSNGEDGCVDFDLEPVNVRGTVFHGDAAVAAQLTFRNGDDRWVTVKTDDRGRYETTLWWKDVQTVRVKLDGLPPFLDPFREMFESGVYDFHVPRTDYLVRVRDAESGRVVAGARVSAGNVAKASLRVAQQVLTNDDGEATLPPLRDGELLLGVRADRYETIEQKLLVDDEHHEIDVALRPLRISATVRVILASGAPASNAEAWALDRSMTPLWSGSAGIDGILELPELPHDAVLLIRHPQAATSIRTAKDDEWRLEPPAQPLTLTAPPSAPVVVWLDGVRLAGPALSFAAWSGPSANPDGVWIGRNLPRKSLQIIAGSIDALPERIEYPWP